MNLEKEILEFCQQSRESERKKKFAEIIFNQYKGRIQGLLKKVNLTDDFFILDLGSFESDIYMCESKLLEIGLFSNTFPNTKSIIHELIHASLLSIDKNTKNLSGLMLLNYFEFYAVFPYKYLMLVPNGFVDGALLVRGQGIVDIFTCDLLSKQKHRIPYRNLYCYLRDLMLEHNSCLELLLTAE
ncbi:hypothetical protein HDV01_006519 [Terramyces sp. JEL0728]|nr:hypothetical protein HDV01_006519 [Terramyces sp. JEL0728]